MSDLKEISRDELDACTLFRVTTEHGESTAVDLYLLDTLDFFEGVELIRRRVEQWNTHEGEMNQIYVLAIEAVQNTMYSNMF